MLKPFKKITTGLLLMLICVSCYSQENRQAILEKQLSEAFSQKDRAFLLKELAFELKSSDPEKALRYARESLYLAGVNEDQQGLAEAHHTIGLINRYRGKYDEALDHFLIALEIRRKINDEIGLARSYNNIGQISDIQGNLPQALNYFEISLDLRTKTRDSVGMVYSYISIGEIHEKQEDFEAALASFADALIIGKKIKDAKGEAFAHGKIGALFLRMKLNENARSHFEDGIQISRAQQLKYELAMNTIGLGQTYVKDRKFDLARPLLEEGLQLAQETRSLEIVRDAYLGLAESYQLQKDFKTAYQYQGLYTEIKDSLFSRNKSASLSAIQAKHDLENKEHEIEEMRRNQDISKLRNFSFLGVAAGLLLLIALGVFLFRVRIQRITNQKLSAQKAEIESKNRELEISNRELEDFAHAVSHDLKQPLRTIGSYTGLLHKRYQQELGPEGEEYVSFIRSGVTRLHALLSDLLIYSNVGETDSSDQNVNMQELLLSVKVNLDQQIQETGAKIYFGKMPEIRGNYSALLQLFQNLLSNGMKFQPPGQTPELKVLYSLIENTHRFEVKDNGIGIPQSYQSQIFKAFHRLHTQDEYPGSGIGLAICQKVVHMHGGEISVLSQPGHGSTFVIDIPHQNISSI
ncbi:MAG: tetratricopeptide repeat protein [Bacteroidia bacterium]